MRLRPPASEIRVAIARNPPDAFDTCKHFPTYEQTIDCMFPGWCLEVMKVITSAMNVTIKEVLMPYAAGSVDWGTLQTNGSWSGTLGYLQRNEVDTICLMFQKTDAREQEFDFANSVMTVRPVYVTRERTESYGELIANLYRSFNLQLWVAMIGLTMLQIMFLLLILKIEWKIYHEHAYKSPGEFIWMMYEYFVDQKNDNDYPDPVSAAGKITMTVWALCQCVIMSSLYRGVLLSDLLNPVEVAPFKSVDEMVKLIASKEYKLTTNYMGNWYFDNLLRSNASHYISLRAATADNPVVLAPSVSAALDLVENGNYIYPIQEDSTSMQYAKKRCGLAYIMEGLPEKTAHFVFQKNSLWTAPWSEQIILQQQFQMRTFSKYFLEGFIIGNITKCPATTSSQTIRPLDLWAVAGPLATVGFGLSFSAAILCVEKFIKYKERLARLKLNISPIFIMSRNNSVNTLL